MLNTILSWFRQARSKKLVLLLLFLVGGLLVISAVAMLSGGLGNRNQGLIYYPVRQDTLSIIVTERGNLESQDNVAVLCEVDDIEGDNIHGTPIVWIVPNGAAVTNRQLLVELDSANHLERLDRQILNTERAREEQIKAKVKYENQITQNETSLAESKLNVELAKLGLEQFEDEEGGTFQINLQDVELQVQEAEASQLIEQTNLEGVEQLYKLGYRSSGELAQARLSSLKTKRQLASAISKRRELLEYEYKKSKMELNGKLSSAKRTLEQVEQDNTAFLEQAKAAMEAANEALKKEEERLARYNTQVEKCKIYAPQDGMVAYDTSRHRWHRVDIREGAAVRFNQTILSLPNLQKMQIRTAVHESVLDQIEPGLRVTIRVDAFPDKTYRGSVHSVAVLPDQNGVMSSDTKVYETVVRIDEDVSQLKPGMTAVVDIHVDELQNVLKVPVQSIVQIEDENWCYVDEGNRLVRRDLELGKSNDKFVEVKAGLNEGDLLVLNPMAIYDQAGSSEPATSSEGG